MFRMKKISEEVTCQKITCKYPYPGLKKKNKTSKLRRGKEGNNCES